jgi:hypothetical protein
MSLRPRTERGNDDVKQGPGHPVLLIAHDKRLDVANWIEPRKRPASFRGDVDARHSRSVGHEDWNFDRQDDLIDLKTKRHRLAGGCEAFADDHMQDAFARGGRGLHGGRCAVELRRGGDQVARGAIGVSCIASERRP